MMKVTLMRLLWVTSCCAVLYHPVVLAQSEADPESCHTEETEEHTEHHGSTKHDQISHAHHHGHAEPLGVMGSHMHGAGEWMVSVQLMGGGMAGLLDQMTEVDEQKVLDNFAMSPRNMLMGMPMLGLMYAPTDWMTLMAMIPGMAMRMEHVGHEVHLHDLQTTTPAADKGMQAMGLGDISLNALLGNWQWQKHRLHLNIGFSMPTGAIDIPSPPMEGMAPQPLPYGMRFGSGTWDLLPGFTYTGHTGAWSWGLQSGATIRLGTNAFNYQMGHRFSSTGWVSYSWNDWLSSSLRLQGQFWGNVAGADARLEKGMIPSADPARQAGQRLDLLLGCNFVPWAGQRLGIEVGLPVYQRLDGPQLAHRWLTQVGWQWVF